VEAYASLFKHDNKPTSPIYISLTVKAVAGHEDSPDLYGIKRIAIFAKDFEGNILQRAIDLVPKNQPNSLPSPPRLERHVLQDVQTSKYTLHDITSTILPPKPPPVVSNSPVQDDDDEFKVHLKFKIFEIKL
jgi:hypothetical protein